MYPTDPSASNVCWGDKNKRLLLSKMASNLSQRGERKTEAEFGQISSYSGILTEMKKTATKAALGVCYEPNQPLAT